MGTQQILLIVLSVIIVGIAIVVGIAMFNNQAYNANQQAVASELTNFGSMAMQWWKTPKSQGGRGQTTGSVAVDSVANFIGFSDAANGKNTTENGTFKIAAGGTANSLILYGLGKEKKGTNYPLVTTTCDLQTGSVESVTSKATALP
jgi:hypothetical protein